MYKIFLFLCVLKTMAFDSDEAKYIDLLPEAEKQEFLNRIARRILEEIQSQGSPEQSHAEVTNDQLDVHDAYVQNLIKEESANLKNEKREISQKAKDEQDVDDEVNAEALRKDKNLEDRDSSANRENIHHIDLTMRNGDKIGNNSRRLDNNQHLNDNLDTDIDSSFSVIPVKVVYDDNDVKNTNSSINSTRVSLTNNFEQNDDIEVSETSNQQYNNSNAKTKPNFNEHEPNSDAEYMTDIDHKNETIYKENFHSSTSLPNKEIEETSKTTTNPVPEIQDDDKDHQVTKNKSKTESSDNEESTTNIDSPPKIIPIIDVSDENMKYNGSLESIESYSKTESSVASDAEVSHDISTLNPLTTTGPSSTPALNNFQSSEGDEELEITTSTVKGLTINPTTKKYNKVKANNSKKENLNKHSRKKLKILSENYSFEQVESYSNHREFEHNNNGVGTYYVYEMSDDKPVFIQKPDLTDSEQPYYVPIYNFAPNNAYYNAYNNLGPNDEGYNNDNYEIFDRNSDQDALNQDLLARNGFEIEFRSKGNNNKKQYKHPIGKIPPKPRQIFHRSDPNLEGIIDKHVPYFDTDYYFEYDNARRQLEGYKGEDARWKQYLMGGQSSNSKVEDEPDFNMDKEIEKLVYGKRRQNNINDHNSETRRRRHKKRKHSVRELPNSSEEDHPYISIHNSNIKDHIRAVRKLLYKQQKFGFMPPSPYAIKTEPRYKRMFDTGHALPYNNKIKSTEKTINDFLNPNIKNIAWDYYWGKLKNMNITDFDDSTQIEDKVLPMKVTKENKDILKDYLNKISKGRSKNGKGISNTVDLDDLTNVLKDMIHRDNKYLVTYNWLQTTVEINSAIKKLIDLTEHAINGNHIHLLDSDLLNYVVQLYNTSVNLLKLENNSELKQISNKLKLNTNSTKIIQCMLARMRVLPKTKRRKPGEKIKNPLSMWHSWNINFNRILDDDKTSTMDTVVFSDFKEFLVDLQDNLYEFHETLKRIAFITTYKNQNWYQDLKNILLKTVTKRQLFQILLHLGTSKLVNSIENSVKKREHYVIYIDNKKVVRRIQEDFVFVLRVLERLDRKNIVNLARSCRL